MRAAAVQLNSTDDKQANLEQAGRLVREAAADGAELVVLPEKFNLLGSHEAFRAGAEALDGPTVDWSRDIARELEIDLVAGSFVERREGRDKLANTSVHVDPDGEVVAVYRKIHMFDVTVEGHEYRESESQERGEEIVLSEAAGVPLGLTVCYDVRFPELYRILSLRGARVLLVPAAFTKPTGAAHWDTLLRARAIENQVFVIAPNQVGKAPPDYESYGGSLIYDPWGELLARGSDATQDQAGPGVVIADLDLDRQDEVRANMPSLPNRVPSAYAWEQEVNA